MGVYLDRQALLATALGVATACTALISSATAARERWFLPRCQEDHQPVSLQIVTQPRAGWKVNGLNAAGRSNAAWVSIPPSSWIGRQQAPGTYTYVVNFASPGPHGPMSLSATWAADNCGVSLQAGTGTAAPTGACYEGDKDFVAPHNTAANFAAADSNAPSLPITFVATNEGGPTGMTGIFTVTAECP